MAHKPIVLPLVHSLKDRLSEKTPLIQVILGPRQVGKTSAIEMLIEKNKKMNIHFVSGEGVASPLWIQEQWQEAYENNAILIIDEIQKIPQWSEMIKKLWDESIRFKKRLKCVLLGSSSLYLNKGLSESLTGRFELIRAYHWNYQYSHQLQKMSLDDYLVFGGYPGSYALLKNKTRWQDYMTSSIVETVITKDILTQAKVNSPGLFRQCFYVVTSLPSQVVSYNKILGQLQDKGNIDLVKYYLDLYEKAFLIKLVHKYSKNELRKKQSSPKIIPLATALSSFHCLSQISDEFKGRLFEAQVGAVLAREDLRFYYWADGDYEVDFVVELGSKIYALEVKSSRKKRARSLEVFLKKYPQAQIVFLTKENFLKFEKDPVDFLRKM